jgi:subtilisin family serine protease
MKIAFQLRGRPTTLSCLDDVVAIRPGEDLRRSVAPRMLLSRFETAVAADDAKGGSFGERLPASNRKLFENAGWLFAESRGPLARAAHTRAVTGDAAVRLVFMDRGGNTMIGTELATVQFPADMKDARVQGELTRFGLRLVRQLRFSPNLFEVRLPSEKIFPEAVADLQAAKSFTFAEPTFLQILGPRMRPTDPGYPNQWQHHNDGSNGGKPGADLSSEQAWNLTRGAGVRIAVIDNGIQVSHPGLKDGLAGGGYFASDGTGAATFVKRATGASGFPGGNHGTFCLGMAGARMNKRQGGCGSAPEASLIPVACMGDQVLTQTTLARAIAYAADPNTEDGAAAASDGADVIACSLGPNGGTWDLTSVLELAIQNAARTGRGGRGVPLFWAVSNGPFEVALDEVCSHADVIAVGRSSRLDIEDGSAFGPKLEFLAPGRDVYSTQQGSKYGFGTGTSYACPLSAGVAALVLARYPNWSRDEVRARLRESCDKIGSVTYDATGRHPEYGYGRINAGRSVA